MTSESFDYVIVGGGTAGCILASRLSEDPRRTVLLLEAGGRDTSMWVHIPAGFGKLLTNDRFNWRFHTEPEENVHGRSIVVPRGKGLGGSSLINGMIFVRGQPNDYDHWAQLGNRGWSWTDVLPYFRKLEHFEDGGDALRGGDGPLNIVRVGERSPLSEAFIAAAEQAGYPRNPDYNGAEQDGFGYYQVNQRGGRRHSAYEAYLRPAMRRPNLEVRTEARATRLLLEGNRVTGVEYRLGDGPPRQASARAEVLLAAGAVQSPQLLELSGIGDPTILAAAGIATRHALPGVGDNYIDHFCTRMNWRVTRPITLNELSRGWRLGLAVARYFATGKGILSLGTGLAHGFVRTQPGLSGPDVQYFFMHASYANAGDRRLDKLPGMTVGVTNLRTESRGTIHVRPEDPAGAPAIRPNFLSAAEDRRALVEGMKIARRIMEQPAMDPWRAFEMNPGPGVESDAEWLDFARRNGQTIYHALGTCSMGTGARAVVDPELRIHGLEGLRIVDASVMPAMVSGNTAAAVMMVAEKASDLIRAAAR
ncbi:MAG: choline dehydrogenase [Sphingomonadaceae bacterium]|nr:choline dehydrogenase [Sphingomonadaceae bacterium]